MACQGLRLAGQTISLWVPGKQMIAYPEIRSRYGLMEDPFPIRNIPSNPALHRIDFSLKALKEASRYQADWIYTWTIQVAALAAQRGRASVFEVHDLPTGRFGKRWFRNFVSSRSPKIIAFITESLQEKVKSIYPELNESDCIISPNGVNLEDYLIKPEREKIRLKLGMDKPESLMAACSGHLYSGRGTELFLALAKNNPDLYFCWFGGRAEDVERLRNEASQRKIRNVCFTGFIPKNELPAYLVASDILLMPYEKEIAGSSGGNSASICSPMKMFEYLAAGKPILSSNLSVIHEVLDQNSAVFCEPEDLNSWNDGLRRLVSDESLRAALSDHALELAHQYSWKEREMRIVDKMEMTNAER